jgi:hypothetical protein
VSLKEFVLGIEQGKLRMRFLRALNFFWLSVLCICLGIGPQRTGRALSGAGQSGVANAGSRSTERAAFAGDAACLSCHKDQALTYFHTAHHLTSQLAGKDTILGSFREGTNVLMIKDPMTAIIEPGLYYKMEAKDDGFYQTAVAGFASRQQTRSERIDVVIGSGVRAQTYLYWHGEELFEMPVTYWSDGHQWINSPGFRNGTVNFVRPIYPRCLECHAAYIEARSDDPLTNSYVKESLVPGISCETCHGPGAGHIAQHRNGSSRSASVSGQPILNPAKFSRDRQVDMCALCHNGTQREEMGKAFSYLPGQSLDSYLKPNPGDTVEHPDVHGNQVGLLKRSRCYLGSSNMTCSTCHDVHAPERPAASYSQRCLSCHRLESCGMEKTMGPAIRTGCIDCHMPVEPTSIVAAQTGDKVVRASMRNHWIKVYPGTQAH